MEQILKHTTVWNSVTKNYVPQAFMRPAYKFDLFSIQTLLFFIAF